MRNKAFSSNLKMGWLPLPQPFRPPTLNNPAWLTKEIIQFKCGCNPGCYVFLFFFSAICLWVFTHQSNQPRVCFGLFHCHLNHWTGTLWSQCCHGNAVRDCAALSSGQKQRGIGRNEMIKAKGLWNFCGKLCIPFKGNDLSCILSSSGFIF